MLKEISNNAPELPHIHPHMLRYTFATTLHANGTDLEDVNDLLGQEKIDTTLIYAHADLEKLSEATNLFATKPSFFKRMFC